MAITGSGVVGALGVSGTLGAGALGDVGAGEGGTANAGGGAAPGGTGSAACASASPEEAPVSAAPKRTLKASRFMNVHFLSEFVRARR